MSSATADALADGVQHLRLVEKATSAMMTPPPSEDKAPPSSQKSHSNHSENETKPSGEEKNAYIESLKEERDRLTQHSNHFNHVFTLIDKELKKMSGDEVVASSDAMLTEVIPVPVEEYPNYNFVGRILGPRGTTAKQLEASIGCKVTILGRVKKDGSSPAEASTPTDNGPLRVQILCPSDAPDAAQRLEAGVSVIKALLIPPADGQDELKRQQLMVLANMNGTYRPRSTTAQPSYTGGAGDFGHHQFQNLLPYGYRLPVMSKSQHDMNLPSLMGSDYHLHTNENDCANPKCAILRNLIEQNVPKNTVPKLDDVLGVMHMYELMNRIRLANSTIFGETRHRDDINKAQEIGNRMCSALSPGVPNSSSSSGPSTSSAHPPRRAYRPRQQHAKK